VCASLRVTADVCGGTPPQQPLMQPPQAFAYYFGGNALLNPRQRRGCNMTRILDSQLYFTCVTSARCRHEVNAHRLRLRFRRSP